MTSKPAADVSTHFVSLISRDELVAAFPLKSEKETNGATEKVFVLKGLFCDFTGSPCRWKVKAVSVKDVLRLVSMLIGLLARGPGREKQDSNSIVLHKTGSSHTIEHVLVS